MGLKEFTLNQHVAGLQVRHGALYPQRTATDPEVSTLDELERACYLDPPPIDLVGAAVTVGKSTSTVWPSFRGRVLGVWAMAVTDRHGQTFYAFSDRKKAVVRMRREIQALIRSATTAEQKELGTPTYRPLLAALWNGKNRRNREQIRDMASR